MLYWVKSGFLIENWYLACGTKERKNKHREVKSGVSREDEGGFEGRCLSLGSPSDEGKEEDDDFLMGNPVADQCEGLPICKSWAHDVIKDIDRLKYGGIECRLEQAIDT